MLLASKALILMLVLLVGVPVLQVFLSRRENRWPGLLLPLLTFLYSLVMVCSVTAYEGGIPWGPYSGLLCAGQHSHGGAAGHLRRLPGEVPQAQ